MDRLEVFRPEGLSSRILGMGDVMGLMSDFEKVADDDAEADAEKMLRGQFNFKDFYKQISMLQKMGPLKDIMAKMPMQNMLPKANVNDNELSKIKYIIDSMTEKERLQPNVMNPSRMKRIASGCGRSLKDVQELLKKFKQMQSMMGKMGKNMSGLMGKIPGLGKLGGGMPSMGDLSQMMPGMAGAGGKSSLAMPPKRIDRDKLRKMRKNAKQNRKKNRKR
jgi:signal recognition particle subunit SRP54